MSNTAVSYDQENELSVSLVQSLFKGFHDGFKARGYSAPTCRQETIKGASICARLVDKLVDYGQSFDLEKQSNLTQDFIDLRAKALQERLEGLASGLIQKGETIPTAVFSLEKSLKTLFISSHNQAERKIELAARDAVRNVQKREVIEPILGTSSMMERLIERRQKRSSDPIPPSSEPIIPPSSGWKLSLI